tara:strand:- start:1290 stop:1889 length:600 start_codon:yes stop_codon:yes gene_type:complete
MSLLKKVNGVELYLVQNQHWVMSAIYPYYQDMESLFDFTSADISSGTCTVNGIQKPLVNDEWATQRSDYKTWLLDCFKQVDLPVTQITERTEGTDSKAWTINYFPGGWQAGHFHSIDRTQQSNKRFASSVMLFDHITPSKTNQFNGCMYTVMQNQYGYTYDHKFHPTPGRVVVMDDRVWHGAYPTEDNRRCLVWDFDID